MNFVKWLKIIFFFLPVDVFLGKLGLFVAQTHPSASLIWPVIGLDLAMIMTFGYWMLPMVFTGSFLYNILTFGSIMTCLTIAVGNTLKVFVAARLFNRPSISGNFKRFFLSCIPAAVLGGTIGVASLVIEQMTNWSITSLNLNVLTNWTIGNSGGLLIFVVWLNWVVGDFIGMIAITPFCKYALKALKKDGE